MVTRSCVCHLGGSLAYGPAAVLGELERSHTVRGYGHRVRNRLRIHIPERLGAASLTGSANSWVSISFPSSSWTCKLGRIVDLKKLSYLKSVLKPIGM